VISNPNDRSLIIAAGNRKQIEDEDENEDEEEMQSSF